jgi:hypothetical protein
MKDLLLYQIVIIICKKCDGGYEGQIFLQDGRFFAEVMLEETKK